MPTSIKQTVYPGWIFDHLLTSKQCRHYRKVIDELVRTESYSGDAYFQDIIKLPHIARDIWLILRSTLPPTVRQNGHKYELIGLSDQVTVSRHYGDHIKVHKDKDMRISKKNRYCLYKLAIYLNDLSDPTDRHDTTGGTSFYDEDKRWLWTAKPAEGRGVLFDMREWHSGAYVPPGKTKYMLGFRPIYQRLETEPKPDRSNHSKNATRSGHESGKTKCPRCQHYH